VISDFLKAPTDNLYKFMCITGLILLLVSATYPPWVANKLTLASYENERDYELLKIDVEDFTRRSGDLHRKYESLHAEHRDLSQQLDNLEEKIKESKAHPSRKKDDAVVAEIIRLKEIQSQLEEKGRQLEEASQADRETSSALQKKSIELIYKSKAILWQSRTAKIMFLLALLGAIAGVIIGRLGFNAWSLRVQVYQDAILKKQADLATQAPTE
jgi:cell division protein FtsB